MLETLRKHDPKEVQRILSSLTSELLPNPEVAIPIESGIDPDLHSNIWIEIQRKVNVDPNDASASARGKLFEFLFREMSQGVLSKSTLESTKARLSLRGELRPDLYDVKFNESFATSRAHGVRENHVLEAIRNANDVEHLNLLDDEQLVSFFLRTHNDFSSTDRFVLLVLARRIGAHLDVTDALRVYPSDVDISAAQRPFDVLCLLVEKYGYELTIGHITDKLIFNQSIAFEGPLEAKKFVKVHALEGANIFGSVVWRKRALYGSYGIGWGFALDQSKYAADLRKHHVHVVDLEYRIPKFVFGG